MLNTSEPERSSKRARKAPPSKEYPGHNLSLASNSPSTPSSKPKPQARRSNVKAVKPLVVIGEPSSSPKPTAVAPSNAAASKEITTPVSSTKEIPKPVARLKLFSLKMAPIPEPILSELHLPLEPAASQAATTPPKQITETTTLQATEISPLAAANELNSSLKRARKPPPSKEYPGHDLSLTSPPNSKQAAASRKSLSERKSLTPSLTSPSISKPKPVRKSLKDVKTIVPTAAVIPTALSVLKATSPISKEVISPVLPSKEAVKPIARLKLSMLKHTYQTHEPLASKPITQEPIISQPSEAITSMPIASQPSDTLLLEPVVASQQQSELQPSKLITFKTPKPLPFRPPNLPPFESPPISPAVDSNSSSKRSRKPPPSKEYPGHDETLNPPTRKRVRPVKKPTIVIPTTTPGPLSAALQTPTSVKDFLNHLKSSGHFPSASSLSIGSVPNTPPVTVLTKTRKASDLPAQLAAYLHDRPQRSSTKNVWEFAPSLVSKDVKQSMGLTSPTTHHQHRPFDSPMPSPPKVSKAFVKQEEVSPSKSHDTFSESFEIEVEVDIENSVDSDLVDYGEDGISYLKNLHPHLMNSFNHLENNYEKEYFLREILTDNSTTDEVKQNLEIDIDMNGINEHQQKPHRNYNFTSSVSVQAKAIVQLFPNHTRMNLDEIEFELQKRKLSLPLLNSIATSLGILCEVIKKQCCMELAIVSHKEPLASYYVYSLQNATWLRGKMLIHFTQELIKAHEWLLENLEEAQLLSYLMLLKFLNAAGTTMGNILVAKASTEFHIPNLQVSQVLNDKLRDPYSRMIIQLGRKLKHDNIYLMLIAPGITVRNEMITAVYHAHEQVYVGLTNMGCTVEKMVIKEDDSWPNADELTISNVCDLAVDFIKQKIVETVNRRPNDRLFIASWGTTCLFVHEAILDIDGVSGIIDLAMPIKTPTGPRGTIGDKILLTYCPTLCIVGEDSGDLPETASMLEKFNISSGLCVVGKADSSLIVQPNVLIKYGITQACIARIVVHHIMDFVDRVVDDTSNGIHTKRFEASYPWILTEDINEHVMRAEDAYGLGEDFMEDENETDLEPSNSTIMDVVPPTMDTSSSKSENGFTEPIGFPLPLPPSSQNDVIDEFLDIESTDTPPSETVSIQNPYQEEIPYDEEIDMETQMAAAAIADMASIEDEQQRQEAAASSTIPNNSEQDDEEEEIPYDEEIDMESQMAAAAIADMASNEDNEAYDEQ